MTNSSSRPIFIILLVISILAAGILGAIALFKTGPKAVQAKPETVLPAVEVMSAQIGSHVIMLSGQGDVMSARQTEIKSEVSGKVIQLADNFVVGGVFQKGELILSIADEDYRAIVASNEAQLQDAEVVIAQEEARARQAIADWKKLGRGREADPLVLREPQLAAAKARKSSAGAALAKARRDLEKTRIEAPYDCRIISRSVNLGGMLSIGAPVVTVEAYGDMEVRVPFSLEDYGYLKVDGGGLAGAEAVLSGEIGGEKKIWKGLVLRSEGRVDEKTRSAHVVVGLKPNDEAGQLRYPPTGLFVNVDIEGKSISEVVAIPRSALIDRKRLLILNEDKTLSFREVTVRRWEKGIALISQGLNTSDQVVLTSLATPVSGMKVELISPEKGENAQ